MRFRDRTEAGRALADRLTGMDLHEPVVLALPRGGVPVAAEIGAALNAEVEVFVSRKVGLPGQEEFGIAAVAEGSDEVVVTGEAAAMGVEASELEGLAERERQEILRRIAVYRRGDPLPETAGHDVILVDDGVATGITARAALKALRRGHPRRLILAIPVCPADSKQRLADVADEVVCVAEPKTFIAVGAWYTDFHQVGDSEVAELLHRRTGRPKVRW